MRDLGAPAVLQAGRAPALAGTPGTRANGVPGAAGAGCDNRFTMPIYEYRCRNGHQFEVFQAMSDDPVTACQECGAPVERVFHPVAVHFKGSGFYTTDYARKGAGREGSRLGRAARTRRSSKDSKDSKTSSKSNVQAKDKRTPPRPRYERLAPTTSWAVSRPAVRAGRGPGTSSPLARTRPGGMIRLPAAVVAAGFRTSEPADADHRGERRAGASSSAPMLETIAFGAFQPMNGPLMKL